MHLLNSAFDLLNSGFHLMVYGCSSYTLYRQIAMDTGIWFAQNDMIPGIHALLVDWIKK
jgi:hypothetical protein